MTFAKPTVRRTITPDDLPAEAATVLAGEARLAMVAAHDDRDGFRMVHTFLAPGQPASELITHLPHSQPALPSLAEISFPAGRFEREVRDLFGITPRDHPLPHRLVRHAHWPTGYHAMRHDAGAPTFEADTGSYPFMQVAGSGVYEIPVGPIHAGLIEPGHFRFSVVGETILRLKARLWFVHRGVEKLFEGRSPDEGIELAERISGDTAVGHTLAYCLAVEEALGLTCSEGDAAARALLLELERLYNHVSDIGAIVNDVGYGIVHAHTQTLREHLLRHNKHVTGHRLLRGAINPGVDDPAQPARSRPHCHDRGVPRGTRRHRPQQPHRGRPSRRHVDSRQGRRRPRRGPRLRRARERSGPRCPTRSAVRSAHGER